MRNATTFGGGFELSRLKTGVKLLLFLPALRDFFAAFLALPFDFDFLTGLPDFFLAALAAFFLPPAFFFGLVAFGLAAWPSRFGLGAAAWFRGFRRARRGRSRPDGTARAAAGKSLNAEVQDRYRDRRRDR